MIGSVGSLLFSLGMCMCLLPKWNAFEAGVVCTAAGTVMLVAQSITAWIRSGRTIRVHWKTLGKVFFDILGALVLRLGMCMIMVWNLMLPGIAVGIVGIVLLVCLIPLCLGLK